MVFAQNAKSNKLFDELYVGVYFAFQCHTFSHIIFCVQCRYFKYVCMYNYKLCINYYNNTYCMCSLLCELQRMSNK